MIYHLNINFNEKLTGIEHSSIKRFTMFKNAGIVSKIITAQHNISLYDSMCKYGFSENEYENVYDYFQNAKYLPIKKVVLESLFDTSVYIIKEMTVDNSKYPGHRNFRIYDKNKVRIAFANYVNDVLVYINYFNDKNKRIKRHLYDCRGFLSVEKLLDDNGKVVKEIFFTPNGDEVIEKSWSNVNDKQKLLQISLNQNDGQKHFADEDLFLTFFLDVFIDSENDLTLIDKNRVWIMPLVNMEKQVKKISTLHSWHYNPQSRTYNSNYRNLFKHKNLFDAIITLTEAQKQDLAELLDNENQIEVIPHTISKQYRKEALQIPETNKPKIISVARFSKEKRLDHAITAFSYVVQQVPDAEFHLFGYGTKIEAEMREQIEDLDLEESVKIRGYITNLHQEYLSAKLFTVTSSGEGFHLGLLEAVSHGIPAVSYDIKYGPSDLIDDNKSGFLTAENPGALAEKMILLLKNPEMHKKFSDLAYAKSFNFDEEKIINKWKNLFDKIKYNYSEKEIIKIKKSDKFSVIPKADCTGCGACSNVCPHNAITMKYDEEGFKFPVINGELCTDCGLCRKICPIINYNPRIEAPKTAYAVAANDEIRKISSSGGVFTLSANEVLSDGGYVCGAAFADDFRTVEHIVIDNADDLPRLRKSKYVQSDTKNVYSEIKKLLTSQDNPVLFTGCPCQVDALYSFLGKDYPNLYTVDLICHGVPSPGLWTEHCDLMRKKSKIASVDFRSKEKGWSFALLLKVLLEDGTLFKAGNNGLWYKAFLSNSILRKSCLNCRYTNMHRTGDLTIGDLWGAASLPQYNDKKGTSVVFVNTDRGEELFEKIKPNAEKICKEIPMDLAKKGNANLSRSSREKIREKTFQKYRECGDARKTLFYVKEELDRLKNNVPETPKAPATYAPPALPGSLVTLSSLDTPAAPSTPAIKIGTQVPGKTYDTGIVGWYDNANYGGALNFFAIHKTLTDMGLSVLTVKRNFSPEKQATLDILGKYYTESTGKRSSLPKICKTFAVASDQLWHYKFCDFNLTTLGFTGNHCRRVSLSTSMGAGFDMPEEKLQVFKENLRKFEYISVREQSAVDFIKKNVGVDAELIIEPVFWKDADFYNTLIDCKKREAITAPYVAGIMYDNYNAKGLIEHIQKLKGGIQRKIFLRPGKYHQDKLNKYGDETTLANADFTDFLYYIKNSEFVVTDSFHGMCFAIIFGKPFISLSANWSGVTRFENLTRMIGFENRFLYKIKDGYGRTDLFDDLNWEYAYKIISEEKEKALNFVRKAFENNM